MVEVDRESIRDLARRLRDLSNAWTQVQSWHPQLARFLISVLGDRRIVFITGTPGISLNGVRSGQVWVFTEDLLARVTITHVEFGNPTYDMFVYARSLLSSAKVSDPDLELGADDNVLEPRHEGWPSVVPIRLTHERLGEVILPLVGPGEQPSGQQLESLAELLPSPLDDIARD